MKLKAITQKAITVLCGAAVLTALPLPTAAQTQRTIPVPTRPPVAPAQAAPTVQAFNLHPNRPRLVVLLHGVTPKPSESPDQRIGAPGHARHYWGFEFIKALQGQIHQDKMRVVTPRVGGQMRMRTTVAKDWVPETTDTHALDLAPICIPIGVFDVPAGMENNQTFIKDHIRLTSRNAASNTMVMVNTRDGSKHLMPQLAETLEEVSHSYKIAFGHIPLDQQPQIYLVTHSFGAIIARGILANPEGADLFGNKLNASQREMANFLRERVVLVHTLAGPHEGTFIGDPAGDVADFIAKGPGMVSSMINQIEKWGSVKLPEAAIKKWTDAAVQFALDAVSGKRDCLQDLLRVPEYNTGILAPNTARRVNGSMVPIYTAAGRNPGSTFYDEDRSVFILGGGLYNPISVIDMFSDGTRRSKEASALFIIESVLHREGYGRVGKKPWGNATNPAGDRVASPFAGIGPANARGLAAGWVPVLPTLKAIVGDVLAGQPYRFGAADGEWDNDGFLAWDSAHALNLPAQNYYRVYDPARYGSMLPWDSDNHGSMMFNPGNGAWIYNELLLQAGPIAKANSRRSVWLPQDQPATPANGIKVEVLEVKDVRGDIDTGHQADFTLKVRLGSTQHTKNLPDGMDVVPAAHIGAFTLTNYASTIIPIRIGVVERDAPPANPNDLCVVSQVRGQSALYLYYDTRTNRIMGDLNGEGGQTLYSQGPKFFANQVAIQVRVTKL